MRRFWVGNTPSVCVFSNKIHSNIIYRKKTTSWKTCTYGVLAPANINKQPFRNQLSGFHLRVFGFGAVQKRKHSDGKTRKLIKYKHNSKVLICEFSVSSANLRLGEENPRKYFELSSLPQITEILLCSNQVKT